MLNVELARRAESADALRGLEYARAHARLFPESGTAWMELAGGYLVFAGAGSPLNKGMGLGTRGDIGERELAALEEFYESRNLPATFDLAPFAGETLPDLLAGRGYRPAYSLNVLAIDPGDALDSIPLPSGIRIRRAGKDDEAVWVQTVAAGFAAPEKPGDDDLEIFTTQFHAATSHCFLAELDGDVAGGGLLAATGSTGLLGATSVIPAYRERGVHGRLLHERLACAAALGCDLVVTGATPGSASQRNIERRGFQLLYTRATMRREGR